MIKSTNSISKSLEKLIKVFDDLLLNLPPRICHIPLEYLIVFHKGASLFVMLISMVYFQNFSLGAIIYTSLHGTYGLLWLIKYKFFPDLTFQRQVPLGTWAVCGVVMCLYWGFGILICMGYGIQEPSGERIFICLMLLTIGATIMMCADAQKNFVLKLKKGLITDGLFARTRNPNYLGEVLVYCSLAACTGLWIAWLYLIGVWCTLFMERILIKEFSLMKKAGWEQYRRKTGLILPQIFGNKILDWIFYIIVVNTFIYVYYKGGLTNIIKTL